MLLIANAAVVAVVVSMLLLVGRRVKLQEVRVK